MQVLTSFIIKNVQLTKKLRLYVIPSFCLSFREFKKNLPNTFIYESILIKIYMNTNIMNTPIFHLNKYDLKGHKSSSNFTVNPTLPLLDGPLILPSPNCLYLFLSLSISFSLPLSFFYSLSISLSTSLFCSMQTLIYILKVHTRPLLCCVIFNNFQIF